MQANTLTLEAAREREAELLKIAAATVGRRPTRRRRQLVIGGWFRRRRWRVSTAAAGS
jgi:hypothetical protein